MIAAPATIPTIANLRTSLNLEGVTTFASWRKIKTIGNSKPIPNAIIMYVMRPRYAPGEKSGSTDSPPNEIRNSKARSKVRYASPAPQPKSRKPLTTKGRAYLLSLFSKAGVTKRQRFHSRTGIASTSPTYSDTRIRVLNPSRGSVITKLHGRSIPWDSKTRQ